MWHFVAHFERKVRQKMFFFCLFDMLSTLEFIKPYLMNGSFFLLSSACKVSSSGRLEAWNFLRFISCQRIGSFLMKKQNNIIYQPTLIRTIARWLFHLGPKFARIHLDFAWIYVRIWMCISHFSFLWELRIKFYPCKLQLHWQICVWMNSWT